MLGIGRLRHLMGILVWGNFELGVGSWELGISKFRNFGIWSFRMVNGECGFTIVHCAAERSRGRIYDYSADKLAVVANPTNSERGELGVADFVVAIAGE